MCIHICIYMYTPIYIYIYQNKTWRTASIVNLGGALNALEFQFAQRDSLSELFLWEKMPYKQCKGKYLRDTEKL